MSGRRLALYPPNTVARVSVWSRVAKSKGSSPPWNTRRALMQRGEDSRIAIATNRGAVTEILVQASTSGVPGPFFLCRPPTSHGRGADSSTGEVLQLPRCRREVPGRCSERIPELCKYRCVPPFIPWQEHALGSLFGFSEVFLCQCFLCCFGIVL